MREVIKNRISLTDYEKNALWEEGVFVFDTNVLLNLYRCSKKSSEFILNTMHLLKDRIWIPKQVALEFSKNRISIILDNALKYGEGGKISKARDDFIRVCRQEFFMKDQIDLLLTQIDSWITDQNEKELLVKNPAEDEILEEVLKIFDGKVGKGFTEDELKKIDEEGKRRYENRIPPGYCDKKKNEKDGINNAYGDLIIWKEIMSFSKEEGKDIVFVTRDKKEDWWLEINGRTIGPRYELREEFYKNSNRIVHFYTLDKYIELWKKTQEATEVQEVLDEIKTIEIESESKEYFKQLALESFRNNYLERIKESIEHGDILSISDVDKIVSYFDVISNDQRVLSKEIASSRGYLRGLLDVYNVVSAVSNDRIMSQLGDELSNSERTREIIREMLKRAVDK